MSFLLTLLLIILAHLSPKALLDGLGVSHVELWLCVAACATALPLLLTHYWRLLSRQTVLLFGLVLGIALSQIARGWLGGGVSAVAQFAPSVFTFFLVVVTVDSWKKMRITATCLVIVALLLVIAAVLAYIRRDVHSSFLMLEASDGPGSDFIVRIRGLGFLLDPNDFAQYLVTMIPLVALAWKSQRLFRNIAVVLPPLAILLAGIYLTHSRGALIALCLLVMLSVRLRAGWTAGVATGALLVGALLALNFTANRQMSMSDSAAVGRIDAWYAGLEMFKSSPVFGIGYGSFKDYWEQTAHNSFVLCFAEIGLLGYFFWLGLIVVTIYELRHLTRATSQAASRVTATVGTDPDGPVEPLPEEELVRLRRWTRAISFSLYAFLATAWFLSRTYIMTLYVFLGLAVALINLARSSPGLYWIRPRRRWVPLTAALVAGSIVAVSVIIRMRGLQ